MELPILVAVISVSGSLAGTITGGVIVSYGNWYLARRKEKLEFKTACRLISTELQSARRTVTFALDKHIWWRPDEELSTKAWEEYKHLLAPHLSYDAWSDICLAADSLDDTNLLAAAPRPQGSTADALLIATENALRLLLTRFEEGRAALMPHLL
jgi:hypothetical protein